MESEQTNAQKRVVVFFAKKIRLFIDMMLNTKNGYVVFCTGLCPGFFQASTLTICKMSKLILEAHGTDVRTTERADSSS